MPGVWKLLSAATFFFLASIGFCSPGSSFGLLLLAAAKLSAGGALEWQLIIPGMANHCLLWREQEGEEKNLVKQETGSMRMFLQMVQWTEQQ
jgi:hypothetical protein